ncbi:MAG TPA: RNA polymerase sigma factor [Desulfomonilia bacterium]|nr:RNA polymerase sigma factor [Desulfomonilia bacterium]
MQEDETNSGIQHAGNVEYLVRAALDGDRQSFEALIEMHQGGIFRMVYARIQSKADTEDLVQDVFLKAYHSLETLRNPELFKAWLYRIAVNKVNDFRRRQKFASLFSFGEKEVDQEYPDTSPDSYDYLAGKQFWQRFNEFLRKLPTLQQEVFRLRFLDHLGLQEIAVTLGRSESAVKTHLYRSIEKFKKEYPHESISTEEAR